MRSLGKRSALDDAATAAGVDIDVRMLDITDQASVTACVAGVLADHGRIDTLINNAGASYLGTLEQTSGEDLARTMDVNFTGHIALTREIMPSMRAAGSGHVISVTSVGGVVGQPFNDAYCAAKFATEGMMESFAPVAAAFGVSVTVVEPGPVASDFVDNVRDELGEMLANADDPYNEMFCAYVGRATETFANAQSAAEVGAVIAGVVDAENPAFRVQTSAGSTAFAGMKLSDVDGSVVQNATRSWL